MFQKIIQKQTINADEFATKTSLEFNNFRINELKTTKKTNKVISDFVKAAA